MKDDKFAMEIRRAKLANPYKYLGLEGERMYIKYKEDYNNTPLEDPTTWFGFWIPVFVEKEYKKFLLCEVLEHRNPNPGSVGMSKPYRITLNKHDIATGIVKIKSCR